MTIPQFLSGLRAGARVEIHDKVKELIAGLGPAAGRKALERIPYEMFSVVMLANEWHNDQRAAAPYYNTPYGPSYGYVAPGAGYGYPYPPQPGWHP
jgi:hypothetical protein